MVVGRRYLIRQTSGDLVELSHRDFDRADDRIAPITGLAGRCVEMVSVVVVEAPDLRRVVSDVAFTKVYFDADGFVDVSKRDLMIRLMLESCASVCDACADECERHDHDHCKLCAEMCRECARDCRAAAPTVQ